MSKIRVGINGFGRIGRSFFRIANKRDEIEIVAINDLADIDNSAYLLKYDSVYPDHKADITTLKGEKNALVVNGKEITFLSERDPARIHWGDMNIDVVVESTGVFNSYLKASAHINAGAKRVVISAPVKDEPSDDLIAKTVLMGVNENDLRDCDMSSNASCTTNAGSPLIQILHEKIGIEKAVLSTVHGYTSSQSLVDMPSAKDFRRGRAAGVNIIPSSTGAAIATTQVITDLKDKFDGIALRVPVIAGSIADITFISKKTTNTEEINDILRDASKKARWKGIFTITDEPIVSTDILGSSFASIADLSMTRVVDGNLVKVLSWYDNEMGYTHALVEHVIKTGEYAVRK